jgi:hypothetical protein
VNNRDKLLVPVVIATLILLLARAYISEIAMLIGPLGPEATTHMKALANIAVDAWNFGTSPLGLLFVLVSFFILFDALDVGDERINPRDSNKQALQRFASYCTVMSVLLNIRSFSLDL